MIECPGGQHFRRRILLIHNATKALSLSKHGVLQGSVREGEAGLGEDGKAPGDIRELSGREQTTHCFQQYLCIVFRAFVFF